MFHVIITNEIPVTILLAYMSLPQHIRKGVLIKRNIASDLCTAVGSQQFCKESSKRQRRIMFKRNYFVFHLLSVVLSLRNIPKTIFCVNQNGGAQVAVGGGTRPHRSDSTERHCFYRLLKNNKNKTFEFSILPRT